MYYILMPTKTRKKPEDLVKTLLVIDMYNYFVEQKGSPLGIYGFAPNYDKAMQEATHLCQTYEEING
jgi:isochorismate hydrolase